MFIHLVHQNAGFLGAEAPDTKEIGKKGFYLLLTKMIKIQEVLRLCTADQPCL
jgi:hypothetical protein